MHKTTRRLVLPGGGSVAIQLDDVVADAPMASPPASALGAASSSVPWIAIAVGSALGGFLTWGLIKLSRS
jgi:hypothetical protein